MELENLLVGKYVNSDGNLQINRETPKAVRIFLSSTFTGNTKNSKIAKLYISKVSNRV